MTLDIDRERVEAEWIYVKHLRERLREWIAGDVWEVRSGTPRLRQVENRDEPNFIRY